MADKIYDDELLTVLEQGKAATMKNSVMWDPDKVDISDDEILALLGLKPEGSLDPGL